MSKKKVLKRVLYGPKISVGNVKHLGNEKDISLVKPDPSSSVYSDMNSISGNSSNEDVFLSTNNNSLLGLVTNTFKAKRFNTGLVCGSPLGSIDYGIDENNGLFPPPFKISLNKK
ncbi:hypothetical protein G9A89_018531 [Geosiphon pyriformis]|nr:hypothetical protein G9A89_018531 [Geosiphon pyriformis]